MRYNSGLQLDGPAVLLAPWTCHERVSSVDLYSTASRAGVYLIVNTVTNAVYVGMTKSTFATRWRGHRHSLRHGVHKNPHLQNAWKQYGEAAFEFSVLEAVDGDANIHEAEDFYIEYLRYIGAAVYNIRLPGSDHQKQRVSAETKAKLSAIKTGRKPSEQARANQSKAHQGSKKPWNSKPHTEATKEKIRQAVKQMGTPTWAHDACVKTWSGLVAPDGTVYNNIVNLARFSREHGLDYDTLWGVMTGKYRHHKGWTRKEVES